MTGCGPMLAPIMVVGGRPTRTDAEEGIPFMGVDGRVLRKLMKRAGLVPEACRLTYAVKEPGVGEPTHKEVVADKANLWQEMKVGRPKVIITLGWAAARLLLRLKASNRLTDVLGQFAELPYLPGTAVAPWHGLTRLAARGKKGDRDTVVFFSAVGARATC